VWLPSSPLGQCSHSWHFGSGTKSSTAQAEHRPYSAEGGGVFADPIKVRDARYFECDECGYIRRVPNIPARSKTD
jgi:hypothetical protein